jgi:uncharacterized protein
MITSASDLSGRTTVAAALGQKWQTAGKKIGYLRLGSDAAAAADADFMRQALGLDQSAVASVPEKDAAGALQKISGADSVIIEAGLSTDPATVDAAKATGAKVISVDAYADGLDLIDLSVGYKAFGSALLGVVLNKVPANRLEKVETASGAALAKAGVKLLATLPEDRLLYAPSIADLGDAVGGEALTALDKASEIVTSLMLGITGLDRNPIYFTRQPGHAAVLRVRAADLQMAALNADAKCLILTGEGDVSENVQHLAEIKGVPVIKVAGQTADTVANIEDAMANARFHQTAKLGRLGEVTGKLELAAV